jgi:hypothetical protein
MLIVMLVRASDENWGVWSCVQHRSGATDHRGRRERDWPMRVLFAAVQMSVI